MAGLGLKPSSLSPSALQTSRALPVGPSVGCNLKPEALGSKAEIFPLSPQKSGITPGCQGSPTPALASSSTFVNWSSHPEGLHTPASGSCVIFFPPVHPKTELMCVSRSSGTRSRPQDMAGRSERACPSWIHLLKELIPLCSPKCGDTVGFQQPQLCPKARRIPTALCRGTC